MAVSRFVAFFQQAAILLAISLPRYASQCHHMLLVVSILPSSSTSRYFAL